MKIALSALFMGAENPEFISYEAMPRLSLRVLAFSCENAPQRRRAYHVHAPGLLEIRHSTPKHSLTPNAKRKSPVLRFISRFILQRCNAVTPAPAFCNVGCNACNVNSLYEYSEFFYVQTFPDNRHALSTCPYRLKPLILLNPNAKKKNCSARLDNKVAP